MFNNFLTCVKIPWTFLDSMVGRRYTEEIGNNLSETKEQEKLRTGQNPKMIEDIYV